MIRVILIGEDKDKLKAAAEHFQHAFGDFQTTGKPKRGQKGDFLQYGHILEAADIEQLAFKG